ncbi:cysteine proteinase inhibitor A-like isoform X3 [Chenopodium quinoa]|uniref:cysteine proteinase inhibitor A-like isoform X3 n=1 Tax=Chenopodium quinoa TaxID=63459 RepID=UPI000B780673|nr:cysteine proteinase inhibitor A-like isoform X3 [Chenopodium quinoa]
MAMVGGVSENKGSENSLEINELAKFVVDEHNKKQNSMLEFQKVVNVKEQVVAEANDAGNNNDIQYYEAKIWVKPWLNFKELQDFKFLGGTLPIDGC